MAAMTKGKTLRAAALGCLVSIAAAAPSAAQAAGVYLVKEGDTLSRIARLFDVDLQAVREANRLEGSIIKPGERIRIPERVPRTASPPAATPGREAGGDRLRRAVCREETVYHTVARGDTLFAIARRYTTAVPDLVSLNGLRRQEKLAIGQRIIVRRAGPTTHAVVPGETLGRIAERYRVSAAQIARLNGLAGDKIIAGQKLLVEPCDPYAAAGSALPPLGKSTAAGAEGSALFAVAESAAPELVPAPDTLHDDASAAAVGDRVIRFARTMLGIPYRFGGTTLRGIDCSAYVQRVFELLEVKLPRTAREQFGVGASIGRDELAVGDLVFFRTYAPFASHVGIYVGDNLFIHASSVVKKVTIDSIDLPYYRKRFLGARRLVDNEYPSLASAP